MGHMDMDTLLMPIAMDIMPLHLSILSMVPIPIMPTLLALFIMLSVNARPKAIPRPRLRLIPQLGTDTITDTVDMVDTTDIPDTDTDTVMDGANKQVKSPQIVIKKKRKQLQSTGPSNEVSQPLEIPILHTFQLLKILKSQYLSTSLQLSFLHLLKAAIRRRKKNLVTKPVSKIICVQGHLKNR